MNTDDLIASLASDPRPRAVPPGRALALAFGLALPAALAVFAIALGAPRPDLAAALATPAFATKLAATLSLLLAALLLLPAMALPGARTAPRRLALMVPPALLALAVGAEIARLPGEAVMPALLGSNALVCLVNVPLIGAAPLALLLLALRQGAPTRPAAAGLVAGLLAGGIATAIYATHCTDDSPLFVATWYTLSVGILAVAGALAGRRWARW